MQRVVVLFVCLCVIFFPTNPAWSLSSQNVVELKKAGVSDQTIQVIAKEKVIETAAFSVDDIVDMKKAGVNEKTLRMIIIIFDPNSEQSVQFLGFSNRILQHLFGNIPFDSGYHGHNCEGRSRKEALC